MNSQAIRISDVNRLPTATAVEAELRRLADPEQAKNLARFFKTGSGQYGEGDEFLGIKVPVTRTVAARAAELSLTETQKLLDSPVHEERLAALLVLVDQYRRAAKQGDVAACEHIYNFYLSNTARINNWDLVDLSANHIVGPWLENRDRSPLLALAKSDVIWERRIAMLACFHYIGQGDPKTAFEVIEILEHDPHDLIQKAAGWMLREIGKRCGREVLVEWLASDNGRYRRLPRTTLRYAIEHFAADERQRYLRGAI
jgi:3-methyladenine DNA glycosylase AlkD